jgi:phospholipid/cholesterol/gamma-HCH transport system substrate-binding protein
MRTKMKSFAERNNLIIGAGGVFLTAATVLAALQYDKLPFINQNKDCSAYFAEAGGLRNGAAVQVSGLRVGQVSGIDLAGPQVLVNFHIDKDVQLGDRTEAVIKTKTVLGAKVLELSPRGDGEQRGPIPLSRTTSPYQLPDALGDLTATVSGLKTDQISQSLQVLADTFSQTPPELRVATEGLARFSQTIDERDGQLRELLANAKKTTGVLAQRADKVVGLISNTDSLLSALKTQSNGLKQIFRNLSALSQQLHGFITENRAALKPALDKLNGVLAIVDNRKQQVQKSIKLLNAYGTSLGEALSGGPFFKSYIVNLLPGQYLQPFVDAAFSDLGLDPSVLLPSQRTDPQTGQPGTPPLPVPYPRTGQGGEPNRSLPDAITGNPDDPRYPYRQPAPAPPPGGPPPGPPASVSPAPTPTPIYKPAPGEVPSSAAPPPIGGHR